MTRSLNHIAYIDDDVDILCIAEIALQTIGKIRTTIIHGPQGALETLAREAPDLILLDVMMPEIDGPAMLHMIRHHALLAKTPVIFMTARIQSKEVSRYMSLGAIGVIPKPFDPMSLAGDVRKIWNEWNARGDSASAMAHAPGQDVPAGLEP